MRVVLIDDHMLVRRGVRELLEGRGIEVSADLDPHPKVLDEAAAAEPDVLVLDLAMPEPGGVALLSEWKRRFPSIPVLVLSMHMEQPWVGRAVEAGADGYLSKASGPEELVTALRDLRDGKTALCSRVRRLLERMPPNSVGLRLTRRELEVLRQVTHGANIDELAAHFVVSRNTAKTHLHSLYRKLEVSDRTQLLLKAHELGLS